MQATLVVWWLFLSCSCVVFGGGIDWHKLKAKLYYSRDKSVAKQIAENWSDRPLGFFEGLGQKSWQELGAHLSDSQKNAITAEEFDSMTPELLRDILYRMKVCPKTDISFWTEKTIGHISPECLRDILKEAEGTVQLSNLWKNINWFAIGKFTDEMRLSLRKIDLRDFQFMKPDVLEAILESAPEFCSALRVEFWTEDRIRGITADCLHHILKEAKGTVKLGNMWKNVPVSCCDLLKKPDFSLDCVHPDDRLSAGDWIQKVIKSQPSICRALSTSFWNKETVKYMTKICLYATIDESKRPVVLGKLWEHISAVALKGFIDPLILYRFKNVSGSDFQYMSSSVLQSVISSEYALNYLPHPVSGIVLSTTASGVALDRGQFGVMARLAPNFAGQLLWYSEKLSKEVLSNCDGEEIRRLSLAIPGGEKLDWRGLFERLEKKYSLAGEPERFGQMIQHISQKTYNHFCATLDLDEYRSLAWLHPNLSKGCLAKLRFKPDEVSELFSRPELATNSLSWRKMLGEYSPSDWALLSRSKRVNDLLGGDCEFWGAISGGGYNKVFGALDKSIFRSIVPECVLKLTDILRQNASIIQLLADDAFAKYRVDQLPCRLNSLSPAHISHLSSKLSMDSEQSGQEKASLKISLDELKDLSFEQFRSLYESRWISDQEIKGTALNYQLERVQSQLLAAAKKLRRNNFHHNFKEDLIKNQLNGFRTIEDTLTAMLDLYKNSRQEIPERGLASILKAIKESESWETSVQVFERSSKPGPAILGLVRNADSLMYFIFQAFGRITIQSTSLLLSHDCRSGFDRTGIIDILEKMPELFAAPDARVENQTIRDAGGVIRSLASQLLNDIERDLVVPYVKAMDYDGAARKAKADGDMMEVGDSEKDLGINSDFALMKIDDTGVGNSKFVWGVSKQAGLAVGLALGKALQLEIRMPFALDSSFYELLIDTSDRAIESYYKTTYSQEASKYKQDIIRLFNAGNLDALLDAIPRLDSLRFTGLSTKADAEEAKQDMMAKTNLWSCSDHDCYTDIKDLESEEFVEKYIQSILEKTQSEFKEFVRELVRGLGMALPPVKEFKNLPILITRPFAEFLPELLNARKISGKDVLDRINFLRNDQVPSLVQGQTTTAKQVFSAFVLSLDAKQLEHLIGLWTGSSTLLLKYFQLNITFMPPGKIESYQVNFCEEGTGNYLIASEQEYRVFFKKFSQKLLGHDADVKPYCGPERIGIIPVGISVCTKGLLIYLQPAEEMLNSLVDLLRTPLTTFR